MPKSMIRALFIVAIAVIALGAGAPPTAQACYECEPYGCRRITRQTNPGAPPGSRCFVIVERCCDEYGCYEEPVGMYCE
jgi:hypothetical protein